MREIKRFDLFSVCMYNYDNDRHNVPHIHIMYKHGSETVIKLEDGLTIEGEKSFVNLSKKSKKAFLTGTKQINGFGFEVQTSKSQRNSQ